MRLKFVAHNIPLMPVHAYEVRPRRDHRGVNLISDTLPFGRLWYAEPNAIENASTYAKPAKRGLKRSENRAGKDNQDVSDDLLLSLRDATPESDRFVWRIDR